MREAAGCILIALMVIGFILAVGFLLEKLAGH